MAGFMNPELEAIRDNLKCGHCRSTFMGSDSQARKVKYEKREVYCSTICRNSAKRKKLSKPIPNQGACNYCGNEFFSRTAKKYCSMDCYTKSDQFIKMTKSNLALSAETREIIAQKLKKGKDIECLECKTAFYQKPACKTRPAKGFCSMPCYRAYLSKRFDRWVANPEEMALPQCYDEFLDREELECIVDGCGWKGAHLSLHMNKSHGVKADDFKRAAGFNKTSGIISKPLAIALRDRPLTGMAIDDQRYDLLKFRGGYKNKIKRYLSLEGKEHMKKSRSLSGAGPISECIGCGNQYQRTTPFGRSFFCSKECRNLTYSKKRNPATHTRSRNLDGTFRWHRINKI